MGESVCIAGSFSQTAETSSLETKEAARCPVLTESVSFGRFASESLQWEKWSAFTQNRYVEEAERFIKPGSVALKKAFFEARFRNSSASRSTSAKIQAANVKTGNETVCEVEKDNLVEEVRNAELDSVAPSTSSVIDGATHVTTNVESLDSMAVPKGCALVEDNSTSLSEERLSGSSGSQTCTKSSNPEPAFVIGLDQPLKKTRRKPPLSSKRSISMSKNPNRIPLEPLQISTFGNTNSTFGTKGAEKAEKKKKKKKKGPSPSAAHISINLASSASQTTTRFSVFPNGNKPMEATKSRKRPLPRTDRDGLDAAKCSTSASDAKFYDLLPPKNQPGEKKGRNITMGSSVSGRKPNNLIRQPSGEKNFLSDSRTRAKSFTVASPFNFRSDERAEKRKEFFKKIEEKNKKADAAKEQPSCGFKANHNNQVASEERTNPQVPLAWNLYRGKEKINKCRHQQLSHKVVSAKTRNGSEEKYKRCKIEDK